MVAALSRGEKGAKEIAAGRIILGRRMKTPNPEHLTAHLRALALAGHPAGGLADAELVRRYVESRDEAAFEVLVWRHGPMVWGVCRGVCRHHQDAEDAFQAAFLALSRRADSAGPRRAVAAWLHRVALHAALKVKQRRRPGDLPDDGPATHDPDPAGAELALAVAEEVERLPDHYRVVFVLSCLEGRTNAEVARELGCPVGTIDSRLHAARRRLRDRLARRGFAPAALPLAVPEVPAAVTAGAVALGTTIAISPGIDRLATELERTMLEGTRVLTTAGLVSLGLAAVAVWAFATAVVPPDGPPPVAPPAERADPPGLAARIGSPEFRHPDDVTMLGTSADGKRLYTAEPAPLNDDDAHLYVWDTGTGRLKGKHALGGAGRSIAAIGFGPDGVRVVERGPAWEHRLRVVDPDTGKTVRTGDAWAKPFDAGEAIGSRLHWHAFSADAAWMVRSTGSGYRLLDTATGKETHIDLGQPGRSASETGGGYGFTPDGRRFYTQDERRVRLHELPGGKSLGAVPGAGDEQCPAGFTPDGKHLLLWVRHEAAWSLDVCDIATMDRRTLLEKRPLPGRIHFASDGTRFAVVPSPLGSRHAAGDWEVRDFATGKELGRVPADGYWEAVFSPDGATLFTRPGPNRVVPWDVATGRPTAAAPAVVGTVERFRFIADGKLVGLAGGFVYTWDAATAKELGRERLPLPIDRYGAVTFNPAGDQLHFIGLGDKLVAWDFRGGVVRESPHNMNRPPNERVEHWFTPDGSRHVEHRGQLLILRDPATGKETARLPLPPEWERQDGVCGLALSADGRRVAIGGDTTHARPDATGKQPPPRVGVLAVDGPEDPVTAETAGRVSAIALSPDGRFLVATHREKPAPELGVWVAATGRRVATVALGKDEARVNAARFAPDGRSVAVSVGDHGVVLVETATWRVRATVTPRTRAANIYFGIDRNRDVVAWSPDSRRLATATLDGGLHLWQVRRLGNATDLAQAWTTVTEGDAEAAFGAIRSLAESPRQALPLLAAKVAPVTRPTDAWLAALIAALDDDAFAERERATADLATLGPLAEPALREALARTKSAEVKLRLDGLLDRLAGAELTTDQVVGLRAVEIAEWTGTPEAVSLLKRWASGVAAAPLTVAARAALDRLVRR